MKNDYDLAASFGGKLQGNKLTVVMGITVIFLIGIVAFLSYQNFQLKKQLVARKADETASSDLTNNLVKDGLGSCVLKTFSFRDTDGNIRKIVVCDRSGSNFEKEIYLTNELLESSTAIGVADLGANSLNQIYLAPNTVGEKMVIALEIESMGGAKDFILMNDNGIIIKDSIIKANEKKIGLGTTIRGQYGITSAGFLTHQENVFSIGFLNDDGFYTIKIDGLTGEFIEGSIEKVR